MIFAKAVALFRSSDGGATWACFFPTAVTKITMGDDHASLTYHVSSGPRGEIDAMTIDPGNSRVPYLAIDSTLWNSRDGGATWHKFHDLPARARRMWIDLLSNPSNRTLYVAGPDAVHRRQPGGWRTGRPPLPSPT